MAAKVKHGPRPIQWGEPPAMQAMDGKERKQEEEQEAPTLPRAPVYIANMTVNRWSQHVPERWRDFALDREETRGLLRGESDREYDLLELEARHHAPTLPRSLAPLAASLVFAAPLPDFVRDCVAVACRRARRGGSDWAWGH